MVGAFGLLLSSAMLFFTETNLARPFFARPFNIYRCLVMTLAVIFLLLATKSSWWTAPSRQDIKQEPESPRLAKWLRRLAIILPLLAVALLVIQLANPKFAALLVRKEDWPFFRNAIFIKFACQIIGVIMFTKTARRYHNQHNRLAAVISILTALVLFVMAGEELSWGQRIFGWATPNNLTSSNAQAETNFHNINTQLFQNCLYFAGWMLLIGLPFWRRSLDKLLARFKPLRFLANWLPPLSFVLIFAAGFGFGDPLHSETGLYYGSNLFIILATAVILLAMIIRAIHRRSDSALCHTTVVLLVYLAVLIGNQFFSTVWDQNAGAVTEYLELYISFGLMLWSIVVNSRITSGHSAKVTLIATKHDKAN